MSAKLLVAGLLVVIYATTASHYFKGMEIPVTQQAIHQLDTDQSNVNHVQEHIVRNNLYLTGWGIVALVIMLLFVGDVKEMFKKVKKSAAFLLVMSLATLVTGCYRPFEPVQLEVISSTEEGFLLPYLGNPKDQSSTDNEDFLKKNLVFTQQVKIPQQWVPKGFEYFGANGEWKPAATLIKVDKQSITQEWTADPNSGTSTKNEAIWVMTSDQVEFSTGWSITAMIASREDAVKFLHRYRSGSLKDVLNNEVRGRIQTSFALEVTDLPMDTLRKSASPHIIAVVKDVTAFFKERGITITNLGITGGFIYKDKSVQDKLVEVFNAEQDQNIARAKSAAQEITNEMILGQKKAEAEGIKSIADAKFYEVEKSRENMEDYLKLKWLELGKEAVEKWNGSFPQYFFSGEKIPQLLMELPKVTK